MRRYARTLAIIVVLLSAAVSSLSFQTIRIGGLERGGDTPLGLTLGLDLQGGSHLEYRAVPTDPETGEELKPTKDQMDALLKTIERRVNASGLGEPNIQLLGDDRLLVQLPGVRDPARAKSLIGETARLEFKHRMLNVDREIPEISKDDIVRMRVGELLPPGAFPTSTVPLGATTTAARATTTVAADLPTTTPPVLGPLQQATGTAATTPEATTTTTGPTPAPETGPNIRFVDELSEGGTSTPAASLGGDATTTPAGLSTSTATSTLGLAGAGGQNVTGTPVLVIEFTDQGAEAFADVVEVLSESLLPVGGNGQVYPSFLKLEVQKEAIRTMIVPYIPFVQLDEGGVFPMAREPNIQRIRDTNRFSINLTGQVEDLEDASATFGGDAELGLILVMGKVDEDIGLTGDDLDRAYPGQHAQVGLPIVNIEFNSEGARKFGEVTTRIAGTPELLAIVLDDEELIAPTVRAPITGGAAFIEGRDFTFERVRDIALLLESGRLPIPIELNKERSVDAILGADSLAKSVVAGLVGLGLVLLFMAMYYRLPGVVAAAALMIYAALVLAVLKMMPVTLTLPGVAAAILSIGMAVDANILIFERLKEELRAGRTLLSAINIGFNRAWAAIRDSNVSTLITCAILFWFADTLGEPRLKGFAVTLAIGVGLSMFSAITVSRTFLRLMAATPAGKRFTLFVPSGGGDLPQLRPRAEST